MGVQNVAFLPSLASFSTSFLDNCGGGESHWITTCLRTVVGVGKSILPVRYFCSNKTSFCVNRILWRS